EGFTDRLDQAGIPLCKGHVMARWPLWRKRLSEWVEQMRLWTAGRVVKKVQLSNILLDFNPVYGDAALAQAFRAELAVLLPTAHGFLHEMGELLDEIPVGLDAFDRLTSDGQEAPHAHALNLKRQGLLPLQSATRLFCLLQGVMEVSTRDRLMALVTQQQLQASEALDLIEALDSLQSLLLQAQLASLGAGRQADGWLDLQQLSARQKQLLKMDLKLIRSFVRKVRKELPAI
ncbi:MAG: signal transduction protein, partial [Marinospirillum sp.]|uniref:putative nucleotidyltransferase substrate binding domain-containing protein n=1 Tax=Marinospirillum sp. TaxID=2183934 RepID=UPI0019FBCE58